MKNNFLSKAYGGVMEARHKLNGLGLPRQWKVITSTLLLLFTFAIGNVFGTDFDITLDQFRTKPISGLVKIDDSNLSLSGGALQLSSGNKDFTVSTTNSDYKIKKIVFTTTKAVIKYSGDEISENTFQPAAPGTSFTLNLTASGGTAKITQMVVTLTTATSETLEELFATALDGTTYTTGSTALTLTTVGGSFNAAYINVSKSSNERSLTISAASGVNIKFVAIYYYDAIFSRSITASTGAYDADTYNWTPGSTPTNTVTLTFNTGNSEGAKIRKIYVGYEAAATYNATFADGGHGTAPADATGVSSVTLTEITGVAGWKNTGWKADVATKVGTTDKAAGATLNIGDVVTLLENTTFTAQWAQTYAVTYDANGGGETMTDSNSPYIAGAEVTLLANAFTPPTGKEFDAWVVTETESGDPVAVSAGKFIMPSAAVTVKATWKDACALDPTVSATTLGTTSYTTQVVNCAGISVLGSAGCTISEYGFVYGTSTAPTISDNKKALEGDYTVAGTAFAETTLSGLASNTKYYVRAFATNSHGTAYGDEISFTTLAPLGNVLVVASSAGQTSDAITALRDNGFIVTVSAPNNSRDYTGYDLVVLDESLSGGNGVAGKEEGDIKGVNIPLLNLKSFFYNSGRWGWGTGNNGTTTNEIANISEAYCNAESHPIFAGLTIGAGGAIDLIDPAVAEGKKTLQGVTTNTLVEGKEGYTWATSGEGITFIHELTPAQRGVTDAKYLMVAFANEAKDNLSADGEKLIVNAAKYLIGSASWTPIPALSDPAIAATPSATYAAGDDISLAATATGTIAATTYTWYKGATLEAAIEAGAIQATATAAAGGNTYEKAGCVAGDAGIYWCVMSNGTGCDVNASLEVTISSASNITFVSAHGTAPSATTGASYTLPELTESGWAHQGWTASIDVTVDEAVVTAGTTIANGKVASFGADVEFTAVWAQEFQVTFNLKDHGTPIAPQDVVDGGKVTKPADPSEIGWIFGGWYKENTCTNAWDFDNDVVTEDTELFAKWTEDPCPTPFSLSKVVLTSATDGTVTGYNNDEYAGEKVIGGLKDDGKTANITGDAAVEKGYKLNSGGNSIVFATLKKGEFQEGDQVTVGVIYRNDSRTVDEATNILTIYAGSDKDHTMEVATLKGVSDPGFYTYRLTAADVAAINAAGYKGIGVFRASSNGENHNIYSVEIQGCRSWAVSHDVTFDMMGHGTQVDPQTVPEGDLLTKPTVVEPEGWAFVGWYKENTLENEWDFTTDVMGTIDMTLYAKWEDETSAIKLIVDDETPGTKKINDEAYYTGSPLTSVTISEVVTPCVKLAGGATAATAPYSADKNDNRVIAYCATTTATKVQITAYSSSTSARPYTISFVEEGQTADEADDNNVIVNLPTDKTIHTSDWYTFNSSNNRTIYITIPGNNSDYHFLQVKVIESGTPIKKAGDLGYSMNFNIGRPIGVKQTLHKNFEGFDFYANNDYKVLQSTSMVISNATNDYIKFHAAAPMTLAVTTENAASFYVTKAAKGTDNETLSTAGGISYIDLDEAADWYISPKGGDVKIQKIEFIAPKCQQPTVVDMENIGLCEGDAFTALTVSASVTDGGTLHYQWYKHPAAGDDEAVGTDAASYTPEADGQYYVVVTNQLADHSDNSKTSNMVTVEHFASAVITTAPLNQRGEVDDVVTLSVAATGKNVAYKWYTCNEDGSNEVALDPEQTGTSIDVTITAGLLQWYKVKVTSDCGNVEAMAKVSEFVPATPANVTESIVWDWKSTTAGFPTENTSINFANTSVEELFADVDAAMPNNAEFRSDMLYGIGQRAWRKSDNDGECGFQGFQIRFHSDVAGLVRVYFRAPSSGQTSVVTIDGKPAGSRGNSWGWSEYVEVPAAPIGDGIVIAMTNGATGMTRVQKIEFLALAHRRTAAYSVGELGTICLEDDAKAVGANVYELQGHDENGKMVFDQILSGEIEAGKPYLFQATNASQVSFYKKVNATHADDAGSLKGMYGTFVDKPLSPTTDVDMFYFSGTHIWAVKDFQVASITIPAHRCYVNYAEFMENPVSSPTPLPGRKRLMIGVNGAPAVATGLENVQGDNVQCTKVLINGQLFILRGEKMYDAKGQLVK